MYLNGDQMCDTCKVPGCGKCTDESDEICEICIDTYNSTIFHGQCICKGSNFLKPNSFGKCDYCFVEGCASCHLNSLNCYRCIDEENAILVNGTCQCKEEGASLSSTGFCQFCHVSKPGCTVCSS